VLDADVEVDRRDFVVRAAVSVAPGERLALFGPSGAGKTTLLEAIAGLVPVSRGRVVLGSRVLTSTTPPRAALPPWQRRVGLLRQDPGLFPHLSVRANLGYSPTAGRDSGELAELAGILGIGGLLSAMPARLSGGQAHRVALGRLLLAHCDALLLDEPFTGLDSGLRRVLTELVVRLVTDREIPSVLVAHELPDAQAFASRLAIIDQGVLLQDGGPDEVVLRPASRRVAELVGYRGFVPVQPQRPAAETPAGSAGAGITVAGVHPERVVPGAQPDRGIVLTGTVTGGRPAGAAWEADLLIGTAGITCRLADRPAAHAGELVVTALDPPCFGPDGGAVRLHEPGAAAAWPVQVSA
jgi:ABC-type sulfate/molybdate transport systems ATPase subunit